MKKKRSKNKRSTLATLVVEWFLKVCNQFPHLNPLPVRDLLEYALFPHVPKYSTAAAATCVSPYHIVATHHIPKI